MADYQCYPLWYTDIFFCDDGPNINPNKLNISEQLKIDLKDWASLYDGTLNMEDPASSGFISIEKENEFKKKGTILSNRLQQELGQGYKVIYQI